MIVDMHVHTRFSPCSIIQIRQLISKARERGLDGICITDHDTTESLSVLRNATELNGICIFVGIEYTTKNGDFLVFGPVEQIPKGMNPENLLKWVQKEYGVLIPAHPFRHSRPVETDILASCDIIEVLNGRNHPKENELCKKWVETCVNGRKKTGGSDAHTPEEIGQFVTVFGKNLYTIENLIYELRYGTYSARPLHSF